MLPSTPPWRVLDAPGASPATQVTPTPQDASAGPAGGTVATSPPAGRTRSVLVVAAALAGAVVLLVGAFLLAAGTPRGTVEVSALSPSARPGGSPLGRPAGPGPSADPVVVEVAGAVLRPGVYSLPKGARVGDAIAAAGGYGPRVAADQVSLQLNLATPLRDGQQVRVPSRDDPPSAGPGATPGAPLSPATGTGAAGGPLDLNQASAAELEALPGIGPVTAGKIVAARTERPFAAVNDLLSRKLVSTKVLDGLRALVVVR